MMMGQRSFKMGKNLFGKHGNKEQPPPDETGEGLACYQHSVYIHIRKYISAREFHQLKTFGSS